MVKLSTRERYEKVVDLLDGGRREPKEVKAILQAEGVMVSIWFVYKAKYRLSKFVQICPKHFWL